MCGNIFILSLCYILILCKRNMLWMHYATSLPVHSLLITNSSNIFVFAFWKAPNIFIFSENLKPEYIYYHIRWQFQTRLYTYSYLVKIWTPNIYSYLYLVKNWEPYIYIYSVKIWNPNVFVFIFIWNFDIRQTLPWTIIRKFQVSTNILA